MRPLGCGCVNVRESCKPWGDGWPALDSPPRGHYLLHVFAWLPGGRGVRFILPGKFEVKIRASLEHNLHEGETLSEIVFHLVSKKFETRG